MRLLFVVQRFHQGWGGAPESVRLTAQRLAAFGIICDVVDRSQLHSDIATLPYLPAEGEQHPAFDDATVAGYEAGLLTGPWQSYRRTRRIVDRMRPGQKLFYLPRGGLADIEFRRGKWIKKTVYLCLFERYFLRRADHIIHSSRIESSGSSRTADLHAKITIIPDHFDAADKPASRMADRPLTLAFMAEIGFRKGLLPFVHGLLAWHANRHDMQPVEVIIAGAARPDAQAYLNDVRQLAARAGPGLNIRFPGPVAHEDRSAFYANCDVFVVPSLFESFCLTALEAISAGCSIVASPHLGVLEHIPADPAITVLEELAPAAFVSGIDRAIASIGPERTRVMARSLVARSNALADALWIKLLG